MWQEPEPGNYFSLVDLLCKLKYCWFGVLDDYSAVCQQCLPGGKGFLGSLCGVLGSLGGFLGSLCGFLGTLCGFLGSLGGFLGSVAPTLSVPLW